MKSKMLGALALLTLIGTLFVMQSAQQHAPTADAATGSIAALNVGTCLTTDATVFKGDCHLEGGSGSGKWEVRDKKTQVPTLYATYAHDPKTISDAPRAILMDSDLIKISIKDADRDKRTGVLIGNDAATNMLVTPGGTPAITDPTTALGTAIKEDLGNLNFPSSATAQIAYTHADFDYGVASASTDYVIEASGNHTLNFTRADASTVPFEPGDFNVDGGAVVRFYGCVSEGDNICGDDGSPPHTDPIKRLTELSVDEDASNGKAFGDLAPWLGINASVPDSKRVVILAIYYQTSNTENLVGGAKYCDVALNANDECPTPATNANDGEFDVVFTEDEMQDNDALLVRASSDGNFDNQSVNLHLTETGRFDGVYQGYLRLTDANGDGRGNGGGSSITDWGRQVINGSGDADDDKAVEDTAAVLAVQSGPVTIEYRDSDGTNRTLRVEIDTQAPTINVSAPSNGSSSGDQTPDFAGSMEDPESGLVDGSFRLVVDNQVDTTDGKNEGYALEGKAPDAVEVVLRTATPSLAQATRIADYAGYSDSAPSQFGITDASTLYDLGDDACSDDQPLCHIMAERHDDGATLGSFDDSLRLDLYRIRGTPLDVRDKEFQIDFQAFVMDMAGNIGFSDADPGNPRFINDLGKEKDRKVPNVLGYYSAHIITLDEKDPVIQTAETATGYFGMGSDKSLIRDRSGIVVVFDAPVSSSTVSTNTFMVELDDESMAEITDVEVDGKYIFLKLASELASDATPKLDITPGEKVEDMAGNETFGREVTAFDANDGISPQLTITLSGGSGSGNGNEGPDKLTKDQIKIHVAADEPLQGSPRIAVVCSTLEWNEGDSKMDVDDYVANRLRASAVEPDDSPTETAATDKNAVYDYTCGYKEANKVQDYDPDDSSRAFALPGENWDYTWQNPTAAAQKLREGGVTVVAFASDRSRYKMGSTSNVRNWGSNSAEFSYDDVEPEFAELQPADNGVSKEVRPFVLIKFDDSHSVTLDSVELDGVEIASEFTEPEPNQFVYWPLTLLRGEHEVDVEATDAAGNENSMEYSFTVEERGDFLLNLLAGWNAISVPADPVDTAIGAVFTNPAIDTVIGWDTDGWRIAVRRDGVWESNHQYGTLNEIRSKYGYWVKSNNFVRQPIALTANDRGVGGPRTPVAIDTLPGWNFVGVIDQDGDQTEGDSGKSLLAGQEPVSASDYLGSTYVRAYTWDATFNRFEVLRENVPMTIGNGVWVYYEGGIAP